MGSGDPLTGAATASTDPGEPPQRSALGDSEAHRQTRRLQLFMVTRLLVGTLLLGGTLIIALEGDSGFDGFTPRFLVALIASIFGVSLVFALWLLGTERRDHVAMTQVVFDLLVTTCLVYVTGGTSSGFTFLYGVAVLMAAMVLGPRSARLTGSGALILYAGVIVGLRLGILPAPTDQDATLYHGPMGDVAYTAALQLLSLLLVTLLAGNLSERLMRAGGQLRLAEANAATLAQLNDDIVRSLSSGLLTTELDGRVRTINAIGAEMLGASPEALAGKPLTTWIPIDWQRATATLEGKAEPIQRAESRARRADGTEFLAGYSVNRLINVDGSATGALVVFQDLTEIFELRQTASRQERLAVLGRLSAGLAHEIRNPLSSISGSVELVRESQALDNEDKRLLGIVLDEVERLADLVTTMLEVGRPRKPRRHLADLRGIVRDVAEVARAGLCKTAGMELIAPTAAEPVLAEVDADQIRQVVWNLVKNAVQASPPQATITIASRITPDGRPQLEVTDQGEGIDATQQARVYEMFHSERTHGAGIGLALVRQIVDAHQARIEIVSDTGRGASFFVTFTQPRPTTDAAEPPGRARA